MVTPTRQPDWLYKLILQHAEELWQYCRPGEANGPQYILIAEKITEHAGYCIGDTLRSWIRDTHGLREISMDEHVHHLSKITGDIFPFIIMEFYIFPQRERVIIQRRSGTRDANGLQYIIRAQAQNFKLEPDYNTSWFA